MAFTNVVKRARISPKKVKPVVDLIRGKRIDEAVTLMTLSKKRAAVFIRKALLAAKANADAKEADVRNLIVVDARVDSGPTMKRFQPKDRGRAHQILKRTSHITVGLDEAKSVKA
jgi:large subunit ribosomal protein L22